jgi:hypothetical protein
MYVIGIVRAKPRLQLIARGRSMATKFLFMLTLLTSINSLALRPIGAAKLYFFGVKLFSSLVSNDTSREAK